MLRNLYAKSVLMVRPTCFYHNAMTATDNAFMTVPKESKDETTRQALSEFKALQKGLEQAGVNVQVFD
jgi:hypothetical protein